MDRRFALVTGSGRGIGRDIALRLADGLAGVTVHYLSGRDQALRTAADIESRGKTAAAFQADLTREEEAADLVRKAEDKFGRVDILVNNVGPILVKPWQEVTSGEWDCVLGGCLKTALFCMKAVLPGMRDRSWGRIVNIGYSRAEQLTAFPTITPYAVAKTGLLILTRTAAATEAASGITVNMVSPGLMEGGVLPSASRVPLGRLGRPTDISEAVRFLVSPEADYITGANIVVAGGWKM